MSKKIETAEKKTETKKNETKKISSFKKKKKIKKNITSGIAYVYSTFNNTIISIADESGNEQGLRTLTVQVKGPGSGRETALRSLQSRGFKILSIKDTTPMPHNGARPPKRRRV